MLDHIIKADASHQSQLVAYLTEAVAGLESLACCGRNRRNLCRNGCRLRPCRPVWPSPSNGGTASKAGVHQLFDELGSIDLLAAFLSTQVAAEGAAAAKVSTGSTTVAVHTAPIPSPTVDYHLPPSSASAWSG